MDGVNSLAGESKIEVNVDMEKPRATMMIGTKKSAMIAFKDRL